MLSIPLADGPLDVRSMVTRSWPAGFFVLCHTLLLPLLILGLQGSACVGPHICSYHCLCNCNSAVNYLINQCNESIKNKLLVSMKIKLNVYKRSVQYNFLKTFAIKTLVKIRGIPVSFYFVTNYPQM